MIIFSPPQNLNYGLTLIVPKKPNMPLLEVVLFLTTNLTNFTNNGYQLIISTLVVKFVLLPFGHKNLFEVLAKY